MYVNPKLIQQIISYASIVMGVLTQSLSGIHLPTVASAILGVFGILLHPQTSVVSTEKPTSVSASDTATSTKQQTPVQGLS